MGKQQQTATSVESAVTSWSPDYCNFATCCILVIYISQKLKAVQHDHAVQRTGTLSAAKHALLFDGTGIHCKRLQALCIAQLQNMH